MVEVCERFGLYLGYISNEEYDKFSEEYVNIVKMLRGLYKKWGS